MAINTESGMFVAADLIDVLRARVASARRVVFHPDGRVEADMDPAPVGNDVVAAAAPPVSPPAQVPTEPPTQHPAEDEPDDFEPDNPKADLAAAPSGNELTIRDFLANQGENWTTAKGLADVIGQTRGSNGFRHIKWRLLALGVIESSKKGFRLKRVPDP